MFGSMTCIELRILEGDRGLMHETIIACHLLGDTTQIADIERYRDLFVHAKSGRI